jgi:hypothetical protein
MGFVFKWNYDTAGLIGRKQIGKSHLSNEIIQMALEEKAKKSDIWILDGKEAENAKFYKDYPCVYEAKYGEYNVETINKFIKGVYKQHDKLAVFDDIDLFIKRANESEDLANFLINAGSGRHIGGVWQAKRLANIDARVLTESKYLVIGQGIVMQDLDKLEDSTGFNRELYEKEISIDPNPHKYILLNTFTHENEVITSLKDGEVSK